MCSKGAEWRLNRLREEEVQARMEVALQAYRRPLDMVTAFKYLGRVLTTYDDGSTVVVANLWKDHIRWEILYRNLVREVADPLTSVTFYKAVVQATLLLGL